jgi:hypothetical protein
MRASPADGSKVFETHRRTQQERETGAKHVQSIRRIYHNVMFCRSVERTKKLPVNEQTSNEDLSVWAGQLSLRIDSYTPSAVVTASGRRAWPWHSLHNQDVN